MKTYFHEDVPIGRSWGAELITGAQIRMARGYLKWSAKQLADRAEVSLSTIKRMENEEGVPSARGPYIDAVEKIFAEAGIELIPSNGGGPGIRLKT